MKKNFTLFKSTIMKKIFMSFLALAFGLMTFESFAAEPIKPIKDWNPKVKNTIIGAAGGAVLGAIINKKNPVKGGIIGGVLGGGLGYAYGAYRNKQLKKKQQQTYSAVS